MGIYKFKPNGKHELTHGDNGLRITGEEKYAKVNENRIINFIGFAREISGGVLTAYICGCGDYAKPLGELQSKLNHQFNKSAFFMIYYVKIMKEMKGAPKSFHDMFMSANYKLAIEETDFRSNNKSDYVNALKKYYESGELEAPYTLNEFDSIVAELNSWKKFIINNILIPADYASLLNWDAKEFLLT